jgi:hypothetical protein
MDDALNLDALKRKYAEASPLTNDEECYQRDMLTLIAYASELEQDAARVDWMSSHEAWIAWGHDGESCRVFHRDEEGDTKPFLGWKSPWFDNARAALDAAVSSATGKMETAQ